MRFNLHLFLILLLFGAITSCKKEKANQKPTANAGTDITAALGSKVSLNGTLSKDPEGANLVYAWAFKSRPADSQAIIQNNSSASAEFTPDKAGTYVITLMVTDDRSQSATDEVSVIVNLPGKAPVAVAGADVTTTYGNKIVLDGSGSNDADGDKLTYKWSFKTRPSGSSANLPITNDSQAKAEFDPDATGKYVVVLSVSDGVWPAVNDELEVTVNEGVVTEVCPQNGRITTNTTWKNIVQDPTKPDYVVCRDLELDAVLTVEPGVVVAFKQNTGLHSKVGSVTPILIAKGTAEKPIVFTGEQKVPGFWTGIVWSSSDPRSELSYVEISYAGGGNTDVIRRNLANLTITGITGIGLSIGALKINNCLISNSKGMGIDVQGQGILTEFASNQFSNNATYPIQVPAVQVSKLDENSKYSVNNGINAIGVFGELKNTLETTWKPFKDETKYRILENLSINSGLVIQPGAVFEVASQKAIGVGNDGYLIAKGTADKRVVFTGAVKSPGSWGGILIDNSKDVRNELNYAEVSYGGGEPAYLYAAKGNVILFSGFGINGRIKITNSIISNSSEYGIAQFIGTLTLDNPDSNNYSNNAKGNIGK